MGRTKVAADPTDLEQIAPTRLEIKELTEAWASRHRLDRGTPEYDAALETEDRLLTRIWRRLRSSQDPGT
jgi:hypothetical protein